MKVYIKKLFSKQYRHNWEDLSFKFIGLTINRNLFRCKNAMNIESTSSLNKKN